MHLTKEAIEEFRDIWKREFNEGLSIEQASIEANNLLEFAWKISELDEVAKGITSLRMKILDLFTPQALRPSCRLVLGKSAFTKLLMKLNQIHEIVVHLVRINSCEVHPYMQKRYIWYPSKKTKQLLGLFAFH